MVYKVSLVVPTRRDLSIIQNMEIRPEVGTRLQVGGQSLEVTEVVELMPPRGDFCFLHATCKVVDG